MDTIVIGMFPNQSLATLAVGQLLACGYRSDQVQVVGAATPGRHQFLAANTLGSLRGALLGAAIGAAGGSIAGAAMAGVLDFVHASLIGGVTVGLGGALLGLGVGRTTQSQVREELEHQIDSGTVLVRVVTDHGRSPDAVALLVAAGGTSMVASPASFTAGVLPAEPPTPTDG